MPTLTSDRYHIKWTQLTNLPVAMHTAKVALQGRKIYVTSDNSPVYDAKHQVYVYDFNTDHWGQLPPPGHYKSIPHIIGGKLAIIGGRLSATNRITNKVSTFDETSQTWTSYYPDLLSVRSLPGVVTHLEHVIVAGGGKDILDDIEVLNWVENAQWRKAVINLPKPMFGFTPIISGDQYIIVGYADASCVYTCVYTVPVDDIACKESSEMQNTTATPAEWVTVTPATHWYTALVPSSFPPVVVGGCDGNDVPTSDIKMYDDSNKSWKKIASLPSARLGVAVATIENNAIIIIGGCTKGGSMDNAMLSSLTTVELGQAELID